MSETLSTRRCQSAGVRPLTATHLTLHERSVQPLLPALQAAAGLRPALIGRGEGLLQLPQFRTFAWQEVAATQVDGDHQTFVTVEGLLHLLDSRE